MPSLFETSHTFPHPWPLQTYAVLTKYPNPLAPHVVSVDVLDRTVMHDGTVRSERLIGVRQDSPRWVNRLLGSQDTTYVREVSFVVPSSTAVPSSSSSDDDNEEPSRTTHLDEPPKLLMASTNLTLAHIMQCRESISYLPHPWPHLPQPTAEQLAPSLASTSTSASTSPPPPAPNPPPSSPANPHPLSHPSLPPSTLFSQSALIFSTGLFASSPYPPVGISTSSPIAPLSLPKAGTMPMRALGNKVEQWGKARFVDNAGKGREAMEWRAGRVKEGHA